MKKQSDEVVTEEKEVKKDKSYGKEALLKFPYMQEHFLVASAMLNDGKRYTISEATKLIKDYLESEVGTC